MSNQSGSGNPTQPYDEAGAVESPAQSPTDAAQEQAGQLASTAKDQASAVSTTAVASGQQVAREAKEQVRQVTGEARDQLQSLLQQSQKEMREQAGTQTQRATANLRTLSEQLAALADGRTEEAGKMVDYVHQARDKIDRYAERLDEGGFDTVTGDLRRFARRRPGLFLLTAAAAGFAAGRLVRGAQAPSDSPQDALSQGDRPPAASLPPAASTSTPVALPYAATGAPTPTPAPTRHGRSVGGSEYAGGRLGDPDIGVPPGGGPVREV